jgi:hypothetical protein
MNPDLKPSSYGSGSGKSYGSLRIRIHITVRKGRICTFVEADEKVLYTPRRDLPPLSLLQATFF